MVDPGEHLTLAAIERKAILDTLRRCRGRLAMAARTLGISRTTLWRRLRAYDALKQDEAEPVAVGPPPPPAPPVPPAGHYLRERDGG